MSEAAKSKVLQEELDALAAKMLPHLQRGVNQIPHLIDPLNPKQQYVVQWRPAKETQEKAAGVFRLTFKGAMDLPMVHFYCIHLHVAWFAERILEIWVHGRYGSDNPYQTAFENADIKKLVTAAYELLGHQAIRDEGYAQATGRGRTPKKDTP